jgi:hypothetical protein
MLQLITSRMAAAPSRTEEHRLIDPEFLEELAHRAAEVPSNDCDLIRDLFSAALHEMRIGGAWKRTHSGRLRATEDALCRFLANRSGQPLSMLDLGASDGITTLEALNALRDRLGSDIRVYLADKNLSLLRYRRWSVVEYRAQDGEPILARIGPLGLRLAKQRRELEEARDPIANLYIRLKAFRSGLRPCGRILLTNPLVRCEPAVTPIEMDCLERDARLVGRLNAVRASNLLNCGYFTPDQVRIAVGHAYAYLREGGCLIISRNDDTKEGEVERGSLWSKHPSGFERREDFGGGAEIRHLVDQWWPA